MQANWSLVLNILFLIGVIIAMGRMMRTRHQRLNRVHYRPSIGPSDSKMPQHHDDIIAVRKVSSDSIAERSAISSSSPTASGPSILDSTPLVPSVTKLADPLPLQEKKTIVPGSSLVMFLLAKESRQLAGYELLQTVLSSGLRFGEGHLFHRHQSPNGQGPVLCSLAAATPSGVFDLQNIGAFSVRGLCLFMHASGNPTIDADRFSIMLDTAKQLSEGLDTHLLDEQRQPLSEQSLQRYYRALHLDEVHEAS
jgi:cell division protein ZipA